MAGNFYSRYPATGSTAGVTSLNTQTGDITLIAGTNVTITPGSGTLTINSTGADGTRIVEIRTVSAPEAAAKQLTLGSTPTTANQTVLEIAGAPSQFYGDDFTVTTNVLSWSGLALDGILDAGDRLTITYN